MRYAMSETAQLPPGFEALEVWVTDWVLPDLHARAQRRQSAPFSEIRAFYEALLPEAPRALAFLGDCALGELDRASENLLKLMLSLAEVGPAVEWYGQGRVIDGFLPERFVPTIQLADTAPQD